MIISNASLDALRVGFKTEYQNGLGMVAPLKDKIAMTIKSTLAENRYGWLQQMPDMREWIGARVVQNIAENGYAILNKHFEQTIGVDANDIDDDNLGQYSMLMKRMGEVVAGQVEKLVWEALKNGFTTNCFDGQFFFDTDHPVVLADGSTGTYANTDGGAGVAWFLLCTNQSVKPIIYQERKPATFTTKDKQTDDNVFNERRYIYGSDMRCNVGYGFPHMAWGSKQPLNAANYGIARAAIQSMKGDGGRPLGLVPNLLVVPPSLESVALKLLNSELATGGETNEWKGTAEPLVVPWLA
jgi:phage major head subunit gpT-like protein